MKKKLLKYIRLISRFMTSHLVTKQLQYTCCLMSYERKAIIQRKFLVIVSPPHFTYYFSRKMFLMLYSINWQNFIVWLPLLLKTLGNTCITIACYPGRDAINFEINLGFLIKWFFFKTKKSRPKTEMSWAWKELLRSNKKHFSLFLTEFWLSKIVSDLAVRL